MYSKQLFLWYGFRVIRKLQLHYNTEFDPIKYHYFFMIRCKANKDHNTRPTCPSTKRHFRPLAYIIDLALFYITGFEPSHRECSHGEGVEGGGGLWINHDTAKRQSIWRAILRRLFGPGRRSRQFQYCRKNGEESAGRAAASQHITSYHSLYSALLPG